MRGFALLPLLALAGCGDSGGNEAAAAPNLAPGQYELTSEVTQATATDGGTPMIAAETGQRSTETVCVGEGDRIPPALIAGNAHSCTHNTYYVRNGRINVQMNCEPPRGEGMMSIRAEGTFGDGTFEANRTLATAVGGDGNVRIVSRISGRRTGACAPGAEGAGNSAG